MQNKTVVIIGGVAGGASCAARLRRQDEWAEIVMLEKGPFVSFANCGLPYYVGNVIRNEEDLLLADPKLFRDRFNIDARVQEEAAAIDTREKVVTVRRLETGEVYRQPYDELVLSPGAVPVRPPLPGVDLPGVFTIRSVPDSSAVRSWIETRSVDRAVIVGGGFIGLEMAENLAHRDIRVSLIERNGHVMPVFDPEMTAPMTEEMEKNGINVLLKDSILGIEEADRGLRVLTEAGRKLHADMVILAIGVRPDTRLAADAGIQTTARGHIVVDDCMRTSAEHVYAVGDAVEVRHLITDARTVLPLAGPANRQGRLVADVICGRERRFRGVQGTAVCGLFDITLAATGLTEGALSRSGIDYGAVYAHPNQHVGYYPGATPIHMKLLFDRSDGRLLGAQAVGKSGAERRIDVISMAIQKDGTVFDLEEAELCYAPQYGAAKDPVNIVGMIGANVVRGDLRITPWEEIGRNGAVILDVRSYGEIAAAPIPDQSAITHIPLNELRSRLHELPRGVPIQVSCAVGARANNAVRLLCHHGFDASLLPGGTSTMGYLDYCPEEPSVTSAAARRRPDPLEELHRADSPLSRVPLRVLRDMRGSGVMREFALEQGESLALKASSASDMVLLARGEVDLVEMDGVSRHLSSAQGRCRPVRLSRTLSKSFYARSPATLFRVDQDHLDFYESWYAMIESLSEGRPDLAETLGCLRHPAVFMNIPLANVQEALKRMKAVEATEGEEIIRQGEAADNFYILVKGKAEVWRQGPHGRDPERVGVLKTGDHFGEDALIAESTRTATVRASKPSRLLSLDGDDFKELIRKPLVHQVDPGTAKIQLDQGGKGLLDVRSREEWEERRIPGATLIPVSELRRRVGELDAGRGYIVYCNGGKRSAVAAMILTQNGVEASWLSSGIRDWPYAVEIGS